MNAPPGSRVIARLDVHDAAGRERFLRGLCDTLSSLAPDQPARWGRMSAHEMVEHVLWATEVSTGRFEVTCPYAEEKQRRMRAFLFTPDPMPHEFRNPLLLEGLPPLRFESLEVAVSALRAETERFLEEAAGAPTVVRAHPAFGPLTPEEWSRSHFKHGVHHLQQFGLVELD